MKSKAKILGITGGTGSGKTTVVEQVAGQLPEGTVCALSQDAYYRDNSHLSYPERAALNYDRPQAIDFRLLATHLEQLKAGKSIRRPVYSFAEHNRTGQTVEVRPAPVVIVEGILVLTHAAIRDLCDLKIYVHTDRGERLRRRLKRDVDERGRDEHEVFTRYRKTLQLMHQKYIAPCKKYADLIVPNDRGEAIALVKAAIEQLTENTARA